MNRQIEQNELRKACLNALHYGADFGSEAIYNHDSDQPCQPPLAQTDCCAIYEGERAKFLEEVFDWELMSYLFYPYFHGRKCRWKKWSQFQRTKCVEVEYFESEATEEMRKVLNLELILYVPILILIQQTQSVNLFVVLLGLYVISGFRRFYSFKLEDINWAIGIAQNLVALFAALFFLIGLAFTFWTTNNFLLYSFYFVPLATMQFLGTKRVLWRIFTWSIFFSIWMGGVILIFSPPEFAFNIRDCPYFGILLLGMRVFEVVFDKYFLGQEK